MSAALSQPDADRFSIFIDAVIDAPRFSFSAFCREARISAAEALAWLDRADIQSALQSCIDVIQHAARIRHAVLDTNAMGALGELLKSPNQIEVRRAATTIISRHKLDLRPSAAKPPSTTSPTSDPQQESPQHSTPPTRRAAADHTDPGRQSQHTKPTAAPVAESTAHPSTASRPTSAQSASSEPNSPRTRPSYSNIASFTDRNLLRALLARALQLSKEPLPREPRSARTLLARSGAPPPRICATSWLGEPHVGTHKCCTSHPVLS